MSDTATYRCKSRHPIPLANTTRKMLARGQLAEILNREGPRIETSRHDFYLTVKVTQEQPISSLTALQQYYRSLLEN